MQFVSKAFFHALAASESMKTLASKYGLQPADGFARRFVAGETLAEAIDASRQLESSGKLLTLGHLGGSVTSMPAADAATRHYIEMLDDIADAGIDRNVSVKLTQLGLAVDRATCVDNLRRVLDPAAADGFFVRIDMEDSRYTQVTLDIFDIIWQQEYRNVGLVLQANLLRTSRDVTRLNSLGARIRLVKGAFHEPRRMAIRYKPQVDAAFVEIMRVLLTEGTYPAIATHDPTMIEETKRYAAQRQIGRDRFEFQMLYGVRRDLQAALAADGYRVRVYVPFGRDWFPYFMRRIGERPANVSFVVRNLLKDR